MDLHKHLNIVHISRNTWSFIMYRIPHLCSMGVSHVKWAWQRVFRLYDDPMVWGFNTNHADMMIKILDEFIESHCGFPHSIGTDEEWVKILKKIRRGFVAFQEQDDVWETNKDGTYSVYKSNILWNKLEKERTAGMKLFVAHYHNLWD